MNKKKLLVPLLATFMLATTAITMTGCNYFNKPEEQPTEQVAVMEGNDAVAPLSNMGVKMLSSNGISLMSTGVTTYSAGNDGIATAASVYLEKTLVATVTPEDMEESKKAVDWEVYWLNNNGLTGDVTNYVNVIPTSDGSRTVSVRAYKAFEGATIGIAVKTRTGGFSATCYVNYEGAPDSLNFQYNGKTYVSLDHVTLDAGKTSSIQLNLSNLLGVGSKYGHYEITAVNGIGKFVAEKREITNGTVTSRTDVNLEMSDYANSFINATISGSTLNITTKMSVEAFVYPYQAVRTGTKYVYKSAYTDPRSGGVPTKCYVYVVVRDTVSGEDALLNIDINSVVTGVSMSNSLLTF